jgi:hypothetical protein|eukprot:COSAG06_NODE_748_length_12635_cov_684.136966_3_plen_48_part_00
MRRDEIGWDETNGNEMNDDLQVSSIKSLSNTGKPEPRPEAREALIEQ